MKIFMLGFLSAFLVAGIVSAFRDDQPKLELNTNISPQECTRLGGKVAYQGSEVWQGVKGCWINKGGS